MATEWFAHKARQWTDRYLSDQIARIENKIYPFIDHCPITEIQPMEILNRPASGAARSIDTRAPEIPYKTNAAVSW
ncbi:phage integrase central domain-containing protein [Serratia marcescens]|uniref:phage integrase central domain-containing protein n=1 Tax=Serratia marcescens TaxID=615 RepID=UPI003B97C1D0